MPKIPVNGKEHIARTILFHSLRFASGEIEEEELLRTLYPSYLSTRLAATEGVNKVSREDFSSLVNLPIFSVKGQMEIVKLAETME